MAQTFNCPNCGGSVSLAGTDPTVRCEYCGNLVPVPDALREAGLSQQAARTTNQAVRYLAIFLLLVVGVPTCLGLAGTLVATLVGVGAPLLSVILTILLKR